MADIRAIGIGLDASNFSKGVDQVDSGLDRLARNTNQKTGKISRSFKDLAKSLNPLRGGIQSLVAGISFGAVIKNASNFQAKIAEVKTLVDDTSQIDNMTSSLRDLAVEFGQSPVGQAASTYDIFSAGAANAAEALDTLTAANKLAVGGVTDVATATGGLTSFLNAYAEDGLSATEISDSLFVAMRAGKTTIGELSTTLGKVAPLAVAVGVSFDELTSSIAALTKGGITTKESVTGVRAILAAVAKPTSEAVEQAEKLGLEFNAAAIEAKGFQGFLKDVVDATGGSNEALAQLFGGVEALIPIMALAGQAGVDMNDILDQMAMKGGATEEAVTKIRESFDFKLGQFTAAFSAFTIELGGALLPALTAVAEAGTALISVIRGLSDEFALLAKLVVIGGALSIAMKTYPLLLTAYGAAALAATKATFSFAAAQTFLLGTFAKVRGGIGPTIKSFGLINTAMAGVAAAAAGWQFGTYLREKFLEVRLFGIAMVEGLIVSWERLKGAWRAVKAVFALNFDEVKTIAFETEQAVKKIQKDFSDLADAEIEAEARITVTKPDSLSGGAQPEIPEPPPAGPSPISDEVKTAQDAINSLLQQYQKEAALASDATEMQRVQYELLNGELAKANGFRNEELLTAAAQVDQIRAVRDADKVLEGYSKTLALSSDNSEEARIRYELLAGSLKNLGDEAKKVELIDAAMLQDQNKLVMDATTLIKNMTTQVETAGFTTREQAVAYEFASGRLAGLNDEFGNLEEQALDAARALDQINLQKEGDALTQAIDPAARYAAAIERLNRLRDAGVISAETYSEAVWNETKRSNEAIGVFRDSFADFFGDIREGTMSVSDAFGAMADNILDRLFQLSAEAAADDLAQLLFSGAAPAPGDSVGLSGIFGQFTGAGGESGAPVGPSGALSDITPSNPLPVQEVSPVESLGAAGDLLGGFGGENGDQEAAQATQEAIKTGYENVFTETEAASQGLWSRLGAGWDGLLDSFGSGFSRITETISGLFSSGGAGASTGGAGGSAGGFSQLATMALSFFAAHGAVANIGNGHADVMRFASGGSFRVGGSGGIDSQLVSMKADPGSLVTITRPEQKSRMKGYAHGGKVATQNGYLSFLASPNEQVDIHTPRFASGGAIGSLNMFSDLPGGQPSTPQKSSEEGATTQQSYTVNNTFVLPKDGNVSKSSQQQIASKASGSLAAAQRRLQ